MTILSNIKFINKNTFNPKENENSIEIRSIQKNNPRFRNTDAKNELLKKYNSLYSNKLDFGYSFIEPKKEIASSLQTIQDDLYSNLYTNNIPYYFKEGGIINFYAKTVSSKTIQFILSRDDNLAPKITLDPITIPASTSYTYYSANIPYYDYEYNVIQLKIITKSGVEKEGTLYLKDCRLFDSINPNFNYIWSKNSRLYLLQLLYFKKKTRINNYKYFFNLFNMLLRNFLPGKLASPEDPFVQAFTRFKNMESSYKTSLNATDHYDNLLYKSFKEMVNDGLVIRYNRTKKPKLLRSLTMNDFKLVATFYDRSNTLKNLYVSNEIISLDDYYKFYYSKNKVLTFDNNNKESYKNNFINTKYYMKNVMINNKHIDFSKSVFVYSFDESNEPKNDYNYSASYWFVDENNQLLYRSYKSNFYAYFLYSELAN